MKKAEGSKKSAIWKRVLVMVLALAIGAGIMPAVPKGEIKVQAAVNKGLEIPVGANSGGSYKVTSYVAFPCITNQKSYAPEYEDGTILETYRLTFKLYVPAGIKKDNLYVEPYIALCDKDTSVIAYKYEHAGGCDFSEKKTGNYVVRKYDVFYGGDGGDFLDSFSNSSIPYPTEKEVSQKGKIYIAPEFQIAVKKQKKAVKLYLDDVEIKKYTFLGENGYIEAFSRELGKADAVSSALKVNFSNTSANGFEYWNNTSNLAKWGTNYYSINSYVAYNAYGTGKKPKIVDLKKAMGPVTCPYCKGNKTVAKTCGSCSGHGYVACSQCGGSGTATHSESCPKCGGDGKILDIRTMEEVKCPDCNNGTITVNGSCPGCGGNKTVPCPDCGGSKVVYVTCPKCNGTGKKK